MPCYKNGAGEFFRSLYKPSGERRSALVDSAIATRYLRQTRGPELRESRPFHVCGELATWGDAGWLFLDDLNESAIGEVAFEEMNDPALHVTIEDLPRRGG